MLSSWGLYVTSNEETLKSFKLRIYMIKLIYLGRSTKVDFYGKDNTIRFLQHAKEMGFSGRLEGIGAFHSGEG